ncbi:MAG: hypothetical protein PHH08_01055 [Candidatus ainarchaeum sp.]|nr:hypothetical protein [Candidatus ainarchaeum sp.]
MPRRLERLNAKNQGLETGAGLEKIPETGFGISLSETNKKIIIGVTVAAVAVIVLAAVLVFFPFQGADTFELAVKDSEGNALQGLLVKYSVDGAEAEAKTGPEGRIVFAVQKNSVVSVSIGQQNIGGANYSAKNQEFVVSDNFFEEIFLKKLGETIDERTIVFQKADGSRLTGKLVTIKVSCANGFRLAQETVSDSDKDGEIKITKPKECNILSGRTLIPLDYGQAVFTSASAVTIVKLEANEEAAPKGSIRVEVVDSAGQLATGTDFTVQLIDALDSIYGEKNTGEIGEAIFTGVPLGAYTISVSDPAGDYAIANAYAVLISSDYFQEKRIFVEKSEKGAIEISVIDKASKKGVPNAIVYLFSPKGGLIAEETTGSGAESLGFAVKETGTYTVSASAENYLPASQAIETSGEVVLELEGLNSENSGIVEVNVLDEDSLPVENAKVVLKNAAGETMPYSARYTDANGTAEFRGVADGAYYAYAEKFPAFGDNKANLAVIDIRAKNGFFVRLDIGTATIRVNAFENRDIMLEESEAGIYSEDGGLLQRIAMTKGTGEFSTKADKKVFVIAKMQGYTTVQTIPKQLWPNEVIEFNIQMNPKTAVTEPALKYEGIFEGDSKTGMLKAGRKYVALFSIETPENSGFSVAGLNFRAGDEQSLLSEKMAITNELFALPEKIYCGTGFSAPLGYESDISEECGESKWAGIEFAPGAEGKKYFLGFEFKVKSGVEPNSLLRLHYRAWFVDSGGKYLRLPEDSELKGFESVPSKQGLYAKTFGLEFGEGVDTDCGLDMCYGNEWVFGNSKKEFQNENYSLLLNRDYNLNFEIKNNSGKTFSNPKITVKTGGAGEAEFGMFVAYNKTKKTFESGIGKIENFQLKSIGNMDSVNFNLLFNPKKTSLGTLEIAISEGGTGIFSKTIWLETGAGKPMLLEITPEELPLFLETGITATVLSENKPLADATIRMTKVLADNSTAGEKANTNGKGEAKFLLQPAMPGTRIVFEAVKDGYFAEPVEKIIGSRVFTIENSALEVQIDTKANPEETAEARITNNTQADLAIFSVSMGGDTKGLLDEAVLLGFFSSLKGTKIPAAGTEKIGIVRARFDSGTEIENDETLNAELLVTVIEPKTGKKFDAKVPLVIKIKKSSAASMNCIKVNTQEWLAGTKNNKAVLELELENACSAETEGASLQKLVAKTEWQGLSTGVLELFETGYYAGATEIIGENNWKTVMRGIGSGQKIKLTIVFTPKPDSLGKTAVFKIIFDGQTEAERGPKFVGSTEINAKIDLVNIEQCIKTDTGLVEIKKGASSAGFSVDTKECKIPLELAFCRNDEGCKGGASEGTIQLSSKNMALSPENPKGAVVVSRGGIAGIYGVNIEAKSSNSGWVQVKTVDVFVEPNDNAIFTLDKYEFSIIGQGTKDSATALNKNLAEDVEVIAPVDSWNQSMQNTQSFFDPGLAGTGATHLELANAKIAAGIAKQRMEEMAKKASSETDKGQQLSDAAKKLLDNSKQQADQADQAAQQVLGSAQQLAQLGEMLVTQGQSVSAAAKAGIANPSTMAACTAAETAATKMNKALMNAKVATMGANTAAGAATGATGQGKNNAEQGQNLGNKGLENALNAQKGPCETQAISNRAKEGSAQAAQAAQEMMQAAQQSQQDSQQMGNAGQQFTQVGTNTAGVGTQIAIIMANAATIMKCQAASGPMGTFMGTFAGFKSAQTGLSAANIAAQSQAQAAQGAADAANAASNAASAQSSVAEDQLNKLSVVEVNAQEASTFGKGRTIGILGSYVGLGTLVGGYSGNAYNMYLGNCPEGFKSILPDFITNLKTDASDIVLDNANISGGWNSEEAKIFGEFESQTAGVWFENSGIESGRPVYALARIMAYKHKHAEPTTISSAAYAGGGTADSAAGATFGPFNVPDEGEKILVEQKFHLKFITGAKRASVAADYDAVCMNGAQFGAAGENAVPKIKLNWNWNESTGISEDACLASNSKAVYCDAAQFSIMAGKRLRALQEFVEKNTGINCPTNQAVEDLKWIAEKWNPYINEIGGQAIPTNLQELNPECWMPKSTFQYDNKPAINYYVEEAGKKGAVSWTGKIKTPAGLEKYINNEVLLIKDGYSENFMKDFADYYNKNELFDAPEWFLKNSNGKWIDFFSNNGKLKFGQKFLDSTELPNAGTFESVFNINFGNNWEFFSEAKTPKAEVKIELNFKKEPEAGSMFYYLPFDAEIGAGAGAGREGYGLNYLNNQEDFIVTNADNALVSTKTNNGTGIAMLSTGIVRDIRTTNSSFEKRGILLDVTETEGENRLVFYPTYATPVIAQVSAEETSGQFSAFYQLAEASVPAKSTETLSFWTAAGKCKNFDETKLEDAFNYSPDRYAEELETSEKEANAYALDWKKSERAGNVYLKTIFYSPTSKAYSIGSVQSPETMPKAAIAFKNPNTAFQGNIDLEGVQGQKFNNKKSQESIAGLDSLFELVKEGGACITNSEKETLVWWNETALMNADGGTGPVSGFNGPC